jgi:excinuclease ABC subunit C
VYWFIDKNDNVLYVGKAKNLHNRVNNYRRFNQITERIHRMVFQATQLKYEVLESEFEALLVEAELIRTHQPEANILLKDDKTPLYIVITEEAYPKVLTIRKKEIEKGTVKGTVLGPFPSSYKVREVLQIVRRIFPWCNQGASQLRVVDKNASPDIDNFVSKESPCFYYHLGLCPGACIHKISVVEYQSSIRDLILFLRGKKKSVLKEIEQRMKLAADQENFELASTLRDRIALIKNVTEQPHSLRPELALPQLKESLAEESLIYLSKLLKDYLSLPKHYPLDRIEGYDVSNTQGTNASVAMVTFTEGRPNNQEYRLFNIKTIDQPNDYGMLQEALLRRQNHPEWGRPNLIVIDGGKGQLRAALSVWHWSNPVISIAKKPDRIIIPVIGNVKTKLSYHELKLPGTHPALKLIQQIRDESHRFSKKQHSRRRTKEMFT